MREDTLDGVARILRVIPGVVTAIRLGDDRLRTVIELESRQERKLALPVRNLGISLLAERDACFVILKTGVFRSPKLPSVYLVEESGGRVGDHVLVVAGKRYVIIGQEATGEALAVSRSETAAALGVARSHERVIHLDESFVIFPDRRTGPNVPCLFLLPPLPFPELEKASGELEVTEIISSSPSLVSDAFLRESFRFPPSSSMATLLVGFDLA